ncbi:hypothetical protein J3E69DRAFT_323486 [Trichoderma sp. SZMC 28015]
MQRSETGQASFPFHLLATRLLFFFLALSCIVQSALDRLGAGIPSPHVAIGRHESTSCSPPARGRAGIHSAIEPSRAQTVNPGA